MGGKGSASYPPSNDMSSLLQLQMIQQQQAMRLQSQTMMAQMQLQYQTAIAELEEETLLPDAPEITEYEDIDWTAEIDEMRTEAYDEIAEITSWGAASGTIVTSPLVWDTEPDVITKSLLGD